ncbi:GMC family oxidoreductase [Xanthomonadaceae bacterium JHOS43]|nr:GMC family oxidoreductase [Xanthomonadaceae bacterium JHOS43]MCX7563334.1 GMC family oxidoreductase [Xanthomonadaceae bacterium XH05]
MIQDLLVHPSGDLRADVCICGAGPAGIVLALELAKRRPDWRIVLLEGGGRTVESERDRALYEVEMGEKSYAVAASRRRMLGGTTAHWGGWSKPLEPTDFTSPAHWSAPDWPVTLDDLEPYLAGAHRWCEIPSDGYDPALVRARHPQRFLQLPADSGVTEHLFRFSPPTRFGTRYAADLEAQENLTCLLHANVRALERRADRIVSVSAIPLGGRAFTVHAERFVLAQGGLENTRSLLNLRGDAPDDGIGLHSPHLGRFFADHYGVRPGLVLAPSELGYLRWSDQGVAVMPVLTPSSDWLHEKGRQSLCMMLDPTPTAESLPGGYAGQAALGFSAGEYWNYNVQMVVEPRPSAESRITLTDQRCELGLRRARLDWHLHDEDVGTALEFFDAFGAMLARSGQGRIRQTYDIAQARRATTTGANHHMGTIRFSKNPEDGVTDADGRVHDMDNLYVAGSALFPRYGYSNPTLTIVALAIRLAERWAGAPQELPA